MDFFTRWYYLFKIYIEIPKKPTWVVRKKIEIDTALSKIQ